MKRPLYKRPRAPARTKGVLYNQAPVWLPTAGITEVASALAVLCGMSGVIVGRGGEYDTLTDKYTVIGKSKATGKAQDFTVSGTVVAEAIIVTRLLNGGAFRRDELTKSVR